MVGKAGIFEVLNTSFLISDSVQIEIQPYEIKPISFFFKDLTNRLN